MLTKIYIPILTAFLCFGFYACKKKASVHPMTKDITEAVYASGNIVPSERYVVSSVMSGQIVEILVSEGDSVKAGQPLVRLKNDAVASATRAVEAQLEYARSASKPNSPLLASAEEQLRQALTKFELDSLNYVRYVNLWNQQAISRQLFDNIETTFKLSRQNVQIARSNLDNLRKKLQTDYEVVLNQTQSQRSAEKEYLITSKINGRVLRIDKKAGELVLPQTTIMDIGGGGSFIAEVLVDEEDILRIKTGQEVWLKAEAEADRPIHGTVAKIYPSVSPNNKTVKVEVTLDRPIQIAGLSLEANIIIARKKGALVIPRSYLLPNDSVQVITDGKASKRKVKTGLKDLEFVEIDSGLSAGDELEKMD